MKSIEASFEPKSRLRTRVTLFFILAATPAALISVGAVVVLDQLIQDEIERRSQDGLRAVEALIEETSERAENEVGDVVQSPALQELVGAIDGDVMRFESLAANRAATTGLDVLAFVAARGPSDGTVVSSAHLSSMVGDDKDAFVAAAAEGKTGLVHVYVEGNPPTIAPAIVSVRLVRSADGEPALWVYGGQRLDGRPIENLASLLGATLVLRSPGIADRAFGEELSVAGGRSAPIPVLPNGRALKDPGVSPSADGASQLEVRVDTLRLTQARSLFLGLSVALVAASLFVALIASAWLSKKIAEPIVDLSSAALDVGAGNLDVRIEPRSQDEVGSLVRVFNHMTAELSESRIRLQRAERVAAWQQIARRVAHEIKNPLFPIQMSMETIQKSYKKQHPKLDEIIEESTRTVLEEVRALNRIVTEFSDFARLPAVKLEPVEVTALLDHVYGLYKREGAVRLDYPREEIRSRQLPSIAVDREQLGRALINLVKNAFEALGEGPGSVTLDATIADGGVAITIADTGPGMPDDVRAKIFTPYFTTKSEGTGLGLAIVDRIVQEHGGTVDVRSTLGVGTTFLIVLRLA